MKRVTILVSAVIVAAIILCCAMTAFGADTQRAVLEESYGAEKPLEPEVYAKALGYHSYKVSWEPVKGAAGYEVYQSPILYENHRVGTKVSVGQKYEKVMTLKGKNNVFFIKKGLKKGSKMYYVVRAYKYNKGKKERGDFSEVARAYAGVSKPVQWRVNTNGITSTSVNVWFDTDRVEIYRSAKKKGKFKKIASLKRDKDWNETEKNHVDKKLKVNKYYYYKARGVNYFSGKKHYSKFTSVKKAYTARYKAKIRVKALNKVGARSDTLILKLTLADKSANGRICKGNYCSYYGKSDTGDILRKTYAKIKIASYSNDGKAYKAFKKSVKLRPGKAVYLKLKAKAPFTYYKDGEIGAVYVKYLGITNSGNIDMTRGIWFENMMETNEN